MLLNIACTADSSSLQQGLTLAESSLAVGKMDKKRSSALVYIVYDAGLFHFIQTYFVNSALIGQYHQMDFPTNKKV